MGKGGNASAAGAGRRITVGELKKHKQPNDAWVAINGKVYDISNFAEHPGGRVLYTAAGSDASDSFRAFHSGAAYDLMDRFCIGELEGKTFEVNKFEKEYRDLISEMKAKGLFKSSKPYYVWKFLSTTAICAVAAYVTLTSTTWLGKLGGAVLTALFWQQCGWLAHDFAHHQVFSTRMFNDWTVLIVGNLYQGFSMDWWKNKHNTHHAIPNLHESEPEAHDGDPDIDTLPFLAWSIKLAKKTRKGGILNTPMAQWNVDHQSLLYFPILTFARLTWAWQSFTYAFEYDDAFWSGESAFAQLSGKARLRYPFMERALIALHYAFFFGLALAGCWYNPLLALAWFVVAQTVGGIFLAIPFGVGHNGMAVYDMDKKPGFAELQVTTTRNVNDFLGLTGWFMGGLHYQIEHHLFPMVPRHNFAQARAVIEPLCAKHGIPYRATGLWVGTWEVLSHLSSVAESVKSFPAV